MTKVMNTNFTMKMYTKLTNSPPDKGRENNMKDALKQKMTLEWYMVAVFMMRHTDNIPKYTIDWFSYPDDQMCFGVWERTSESSAVGRNWFCLDGK